MLTCVLHSNVSGNFRLWDNRLFHLAHYAVALSVHMMMKPEEKRERERKRHAEGEREREGALNEEKRDEESGPVDLYINSHRKRVSMCGSTGQ